MAWDLLYLLQMSKPQTFQDFVTKGHDMEVTIANHRESSFNVVESKKNRDEFRKSVMFSTSSTKEAMTIFKARPVQILGGPNPNEKRSMPFKDTISRRATLKELLEKKHLFPDSDLSGTLDDLRSFNFRSQRGPNMLEGLLTQNTVVIIGW